MNYKVKDLLGDKNITYVVGQNNCSCFIPVGVLL